MRKRKWLWTIFLMLAGGAVAIRLVEPRYQLWKAERELNQIYRRARPFAYRWPGAPYGATNAASSYNAAPDLEDVTLRLARLHKDWGGDPRWLRLSARLALLARRDGTAVAQYRRAQVLSGDETGLKTELAAAYALRAESENRASDFGVALEFAAETLTASTVSDVARFNGALLLEGIPLPRLAAQEWREAAAAESDGGWRREAASRRSKLEERLAQRQASIERLKNHESFLVAGTEAPGALEVAQQAAIETWISVPRPPREALQRLAASFRSRHGDLWWQDFLAGPGTAAASALLSRTLAANLNGEYAEAEKAGEEAEAAFSRLGNPAGRLRARWEQIIASHRGDHPRNCEALLVGFGQETGKRSYRWLKAQSGLDSITCRTILGKGASLEERYRAFEQAEETAFEGIALRALAFLTEPQVTSGSPLKVWTSARRGLERFWSSVLPDYRAYHFCWSLSETARIAGDSKASVMLLRESVRALSAEANLGLSASVAGDLAAAEAQAGLHRDAARHLDEASHLSAASGLKTPEKYAYQIETQRAQAELAAGQPETAAARLERALRTERAANKPNDMDKADLLSAYGMALLRLGRYPDAAARFEELIALNNKVLSAPEAQLERESVTRLYEGAFRGLSEARLRCGDTPETALTAWRAFRRGRATIPPKQTASLPAGTALLTFAVLPGGISAWFADRGGVEQRWIDGARVRQLVSRLTGLAADPESRVTAVSAVARDAEALLLSPFETRLKQLAAARPPATLLIDADGVLAEIPWALLESLKGETLIARYSIVQTVGRWQPPSRTERTISPSSHAAVFADPALDEWRSEFPPLADARQEGRRVGGRFRWVTLLEGVEAKGAAFVAVAPRVQVLHFAGHGVSNGGFGGLVMAGRPAFVTAEQISRLDLSRLDLAVLAACSAGVGQERGAVSADTLVRAFLDAGASRVVAASWNVDSLATSGFTDRFYEQLLRGESAAASLRGAILALRSQPATAHPAAWAAFQLYGAP